MDVCPVEVSVVVRDGDGVGVGSADRVNDDDDAPVETRRGVMRAVDSMATEEVSDDNNGTYWRALKVIKNECCTSESAVRQVHHMNWITDTRTCTISARERCWKFCVRALLLDERFWICSRIQSSSKTVIMDTEQSWMLRT